MMRKINDAHFRQSLISIAVPVTVQSMLQNSFSMVDEIMIGSLGSISIAAIGLASQFSSIFSFISAAVGSVAGIMMAQYLGAGQKRYAGRSFSINLITALTLSFIFMLISSLMPKRIIGLYSSDGAAIAVGAKYLRIVSLSYIPLAVNAILASLFQCREKAAVTMYASFAAVICNTFLNYVLIFGHFGLPALGAEGAAIATTVSQWLNLLIRLVLMLILNKSSEVSLPFCFEGFEAKQYVKILLPIVASEALWCLAENLYTVVYGHIGTASMAAMSLCIPVICITIGLLSGISAAAGVIIGKELGSKKYETAYLNSISLMDLSLIFIIIFSAIVFGLRKIYVSIYNVEDEVRLLATQILTVFALYAPIKVLNMVLGGGILRSGGDTKTIFILETIGTWVFGVPLAFIGGFVLKLSIPYVYLMLSIEEIVRLSLLYIFFKSKKWMITIQ